MPRLDSSDSEDDRLGSRSSGPRGSGGPSSSSGGGAPVSVPDGHKLKGYQQIYVIKKPIANSLDTYSGEREVLFRCGNWCYVGRVTLDFGNAAGPSDDASDDEREEQSMSLKDIPRIIPILQRQQSKLAFYCNANAIPRQSDFHDPVEAMIEAQNFIASELQSDDVAEKLQEMEDMYPWMSSDEVKSYFELTVNVPDKAMDGIQCICSKTYSRGLIFVTMYFDSTYYVTISEGMGDQPLLDVRFPNVSAHGEGISLKRYTDDELLHKFHSLGLWQSLGGDPKSAALLAPKAKKTKNLSSDSYIQSYCVLKPSADSPSSNPSSSPPGVSQFRSALFRFGSWCYSGRVQLVEHLTLADLPHVIPALRLQQSRLEFFCDVGQVPARSPFARPLEYSLKVAPVMESEVSASEDVLQNLVKRLGDMGLGDSISQWLDGDPSQSFFEFSVAMDPETEKAHRGVELLCSKCYTPNGLVTIAIYFQGVYYLTLQEGGGEQPLLDSKFPNVAAKGRGYQIAAYSNGVKGWPALRKVSVWQTASAMQQEMELRMTKVGEAKSVGGSSFSAAVAISEERLSKLVDSELELAGGGEQIVAEAKSSSAHADSAVAAAKSSGPDIVADAKQSLTGGGGGEGASAAVAGAGAAAQSGSPQSKGLAADSASPTSRSFEGDVESLRAESKDGGGGAASAQNSNKVNLGAFHHLAPMKKPSALEAKLGDFRQGSEAGLSAGAAPWDPFGKPVLGKMGSSKLGGLSKLESKPI